MCQDVTAQRELWSSAGRAAVPAAEMGTASLYQGANSSCSMLDYVLEKSFAREQREVRSVALFLLSGSVSGF